MSDLVPPTGRVHWIGTGLSTGRGLRVLTEQAKSVVLWGRTDTRAKECLNRLDIPGGVPTRTFDHETLATELHQGDVVVSMLPAGEHLALLRLCLDRGAHFACSSYVSEDLAALAPAAARVGIAVQTEAGLDPGIDHLLAHMLITRARAEIDPNTPATARFMSYCGGVPAVPNEFRYRFSWAPRAVLTALLSPARYIEEGQEQVVTEPWTATTTHTIAGEQFEVYPNRDSVPFVEQYHLPAAWHPETFVRGTARLSGWRDAWAGVFPVLHAGDPGEIDALARKLAAAHPMTDTDRDRVILSVSLTINDAWAGEYVLDQEGTETETAMATTVSVTLARGVLDILEGRTTPGLHRATENEAAVTRWLTFLTENGVACHFRPTTTQSD